jgi:hypothetical protein
MSVCTYTTIRWKGFRGRKKKDITSRIVAEDKR